MALADWSQHEVSAACLPAPQLRHHCTYMGQHASFRNSNAIQYIPRMICEKKWLERRGVCDRSARQEGNPQHWFVCARVQDRCGISTSLGCRRVLSHVKKIQTVLEVSETNKPTSLHNKKNQVRRHTCRSCRVAVFSADKFSNGVSRTPNK